MRVFRVATTETEWDGLGRKEIGESHRESHQQLIRISGAADSRDDAQFGASLGARAPQPYNRGHQRGLSPCQPRTQRLRSRGPAMPAPTCYTHAETPLMCLRCLGHRGGCRTSRAKRRAARANGWKPKRRRRPVQRIRLALPRLGPQEQASS
jgi:hypothetical protein